MIGSQTFNSVYISSMERTTILTLNKIINCQPGTTPIFNLTIYSLLTSTPIITKTIKGVKYHHEIVFNYSFKITFNPQEKDIILQIAQSQNYYSFSKNAEFTIDLEELIKKELLFCPMGNTDSILKITSSQLSPSTFRHHEPYVQAHRQRLNMKRPHMGAKSNRSSVGQSVRSLYEALASKNKPSPRGLASTSTSYLPQKSLNKRAFSQRAKQLLQQVQQMRKKAHQPKQKNIQDQFNEYYAQQQPQAKTSNQFFETRSRKEKRSQRKEAPRGRALEREFMTDSSRKSSVSQKHRLVLGSLKMQACENQYYEELQESRSSRDNQMRLNPPTQRYFQPHRL